MFGKMGVGKGGVGVHACGVVVCVRVQAVFDNK